MVVTETCMIIGMNWTKLLLYIAIITLVYAHSHRLSSVLQLASSLLTGQVQEICLCIGIEIMFFWNDSTSPYLYVLFITSIHIQIMH